MKPKMNAEILKRCITDETYSVRCFKSLKMTNTYKHLDGFLDTEIDKHERKLEKYKEDLKIAENGDTNNETK